MLQSIMWPKEYSELKHIEDLLICGICYEFMETSVITSCSHNYCSLCIRKYLHYKAQCPVCFSETFEKDLRKNKALDEIISKFSQIKSKLKRCLQIQVQFVQNDRGDVNVDTPVNTPIKESVNHNNETCTSKEGECVTNSRTIFNNNASPSVHKKVQETQKDISSPSTSGKSKIPLMFTPKSIKRINASNTEDTKVVICPVCKVTVSEININRHLDDCLKRESKQGQPQKVEQKRNPLPKLVFNLMKDAVIRKKLKEFGLSSQGDRKVMENRLQRYIILYNAECDKSNPRPISELIKQCEDEENLEKKVNKTSLFTNKLQVNRNTEENIIDTERKKYLDTNKESFESLIKKIKGREIGKKSSVRRSLLNECNESSEEIPNKIQEVANENSDDSINTPDKNDFQPINYNAYIQDSDSDTSCPLQMYSSTDPQKFLNADLSIEESITKKEVDIHFEESPTKKGMNYSHVKTEKDMNSDTLNNVSMLSKNIPKDDSRVNNTRYKMLLQRKEKSCLNDEMRRMDCVSTSVDDSDSNNGSEIDVGNEKPIPVLHDILCDISSNDSIDSKFYHGKLHSIDHSYLNSSMLNTSNLEKENILSSPECSRNRSLRKRSRQTTQTENKLISSTKKNMKYSSIRAPSGTEESTEECLSTWKHNEEKHVPKKPRLRKRVTNMAVTEDTTIRKSTRTRTKRNS